MSASCSRIVVRCENPRCNRLIPIDKALSTNGHCFCSISCIHDKIEEILGGVSEMLKTIGDVVRPA